MPLRVKEIACSGSSRVLNFAAQEFCRYANAMAGEAAWAQGAAGDVTLAVAPRALADHGCTLLDPTVDDAFEIEVQGGKGHIWGSNGISVLMGVYALMELAGCRFLRPGPQGEVLGKADLRVGRYALCQQAALRHRGVVIEGANSLDHLLDFLDWLPKNRMNSFFTQFQSIHLFFQRYYEHWNNPLRQPEACTREMTQAYERRMEAEMARRGLRRHAVGHGWTCGALGVEGIDWEPIQAAPPADMLPLLAQVNGRRGYFRQVPSTTNLCYSNPEARRRLTDYIAGYLEEHPQIDYASVWLADDWNNFCECPACRAKRPADWYLLLLNELDEALTRRGLAARVVFLMYLDLLWPPQVEKLRHPERFTLMFAPFTRPYGASLNQAKPLATSPFALNQIKLPRSLGENLGYWAQWREIWQGDTFSFDYYLGRAHYGDLGYMSLTRVIAQDIEAFKGLGLNGLMSCQELRCAFPTALPNYVMGRKLWQPGLETQGLIRDYFCASFGSGWERALAYLEKVSEACDVDDWFSASPAPDPQAAPRWLGAVAAAEEDQAFISAQEPLHQGAQALSWRYLACHTLYTKELARALYHRQMGQLPQARRHFRQLAAWLAKEEESLQPALDVYRLLELGKLRGLEPFDEKKRGQPQ